MMQLTKHVGADDLLAVAGAFLGEREAASSLIFGILSGRARDASKPAPYLASIAKGGSVVGVAVWTPPFPLLVTELPIEAVELLAEDLSHRDAPLEAVHAPAEVADAFARAWTARTGGKSSLRFRFRVFTLDAVIEPRWAKGAMRVAVESDLALAAEWIDAFVREAGLPSIEPPAEHAARRVRDGALHLWDDDGAVSMAMVGGATPNGARIGLVYTPPHRRGHGYASSCVAALSQKLLQSGRKFCFLSTDLANPTSNAIYPRLGYRAGGDTIENAFERSDT